MTQEDKNLLLKDLCARLPYETYIEIVDKNGNVHDEVELGPEHINVARYDESTSIRPYLRPKASMTEEEYQEFGYDVLRYTPREFDWLNAHHFDCRGLIEKGLALEAPEGMYKN